MQQIYIVILVLLFIAEGVCANSDPYYTSKGVQLSEHESLKGGHTLKQHVGVSVETLDARLIKRLPYIGNRYMVQVSSFEDEWTAQTLTNETIRHNLPAIKHWLNNTDEYSYRFTKPYGNTWIGTCRVVYPRTGKLTPESGNCNSVTIQLRRNVAKGRKHRRFPDLGAFIVSSSYPSITQ